MAKQHLNLNNIQISFFAVSSERQRRWILWNQNFPQEMQWCLKQYRSLSHWVTDTFCSANIAIFAEILTPSKWSLCSHTPTRWGGAGDKARMELLAKLEVATKSGTLGKVSRVGHGCSSINSFKYNLMENNIDKSWIVIFAGRVGTLLSCNCVTKMRAHFESLGPCLSLSVLQSPCMFWEDLFLSLFVWHKCIFHRLLNDYPRIVLAFSAWPLANRAHYGCTSKIVPWRCFATHPRQHCGLHTKLRNFTVINLPVARSDQELEKRTCHIGPKKVHNDSKWISTF